jgi:hypothetical protein
MPGPSPEEILRSGKLPVTDENVSVLLAGLDRLRSLYGLIRLTLKQPSISSQKDDLKRLKKAAEEIGKVLDADFDTGSSIEVTLASVGASFPTGLRDWLRRVPKAVTDLTIMLDSEVSKTRQEDPVTWAMTALHDLYGTIAGKPPGIAGPLQRFTAAAIAQLNLPVQVPAGENAFRGRLKAALKRRSGPVNLLPLTLLSPEP